MIIFWKFWKIASCYDHNTDCVCFYTCSLLPQLQVLRLFPSTQHDNVKIETPNSGNFEDEICAFQSFFYHFVRNNFIIMISLFHPTQFIMHTILISTTAFGVFRSTNFSNAMTTRRGKNYDILCINRQMLQFSI